MQLTTILSTKGSAVITIHPEASIAGLVAMLSEHSVGALVVSPDGSTISGIVSERDVVRALNHGSAVLAAHPQEQESLHEELSQIVRDAPLTIDDYPRLVRTRAVFDEALRLYPPAWLITRKALASGELSGRKVPAGSLVPMSTPARAASGMTATRPPPTRTTARSTTE